MKINEKTRTILSAVAAGILLAPGAVLFAWRFQILSYSRWIKLSLPAVLAFVILALIFNAFFPIRLADLKRKQTLYALAGSLAVSLAVVHYAEGLLRYLAALLVTTLFFFIIGCAFVKLYKLGKRGLLSKLYHLLFLVTGMVGFLIYLYMAFFVRLYGDDFCFTTWVRQDGFFPTLSNFYKTWSGRVFSDLFMFSFSSAQILPFIEILLLALLIFYLLRFFRQDTIVRFPLWTAVAAFFLPFAVFYAIPDPYKSLYWITNTELIFPVVFVFLIFLVFMVRGFMNGFKRKWAQAAAFVMAAAVGCGHEIMIPALFLIIAIFLLYAIFEHKRFGKRPIIVSTAALLGAIVGALILLLAPGNYARMATQGYPPTPGLSAAIGMAAGYYINFFAKLAANWKWVVLPAAFVLGLNTRSLLPKSWKAFILVLLYVTVVAWAMFVVSAFAMSDTLPTRTQIYPMFFIIFGLFAAGAVMPRPQSNAAIITAAAAGLLLFGFAFTQMIPNETRMVAPIVQFASDWDTRDQKLRTTNEQVYSITIPWDYMEQQPGCVKEYYGR